MKQFLLPRWYAGEPRISLSGGDFRHVARVLRMRDGDTLDAVDSRGALYEMRILRVGRAECEVQLSPARGSGIPMPPHPARAVFESHSSSACQKAGKSISLSARPRKQVLRGSCCS